MPALRQRRACCANTCSSNELLCVMSRPDPQAPAAERQRVGPGRGIAVCCPSFTGALPVLHQFARRARVPAQWRLSASASTQVLHWLCIGKPTAVHQKARCSSCRVVALGRQCTGCASLPLQNACRALACCVLCTRLLYQADVYQAARRNQLPRAGGQAPSALSLGASPRVNAACLPCKLGCTQSPIAAQPPCKAPASKPCQRAGACASVFGLQKFQRNKKCA
jgi:hypothetical protein